MIIKWRQGEIIGMGSSSIVYSAIRVDNNTLIAVKKFKVVSDITGIDQNKLKIIKVSKDFMRILIMIFEIYRTKSKSTSSSKMIIS